jgi:hypothetical protein
MERDFNAPEQTPLSIASDARNIRFMSQFIRHEAVMEGLGVRLRFAA